MVLYLLAAAGVLALGRLRAEEVSPDLSTTASPLSKEERAWIEDVVAPLATPDEKKLYLSLPAPYQRTEFRRRFWEIRERDGLKPPYGPGFRSLYEQRLEAANEKYSGWKSDAGRIVLARGEPVQSIEIDCPDTYRPIQIWTMGPSPGESRPPRLLLYRDFAGGPLKLWTPILGAEALLAPGRTGRADLTQTILQRCGVRSREMPCPHECDELLSAYTALQQNGDLGAMSELEKFAEFPATPESDWVDWRSRFVQGGALTPKTKEELTLESPKAEAPSAPARKLSREDRKKLTAALPERFREWLAEVEIIITDAERDVFLQVKDNVERDKFMEEFWRRRSVDKDGIRTNFRQVYEARLEYCKDNFKSLTCDASKVLLLNGPPDAVITINCDEFFVPTRIWYYERLEALKSKVYLIFYKRYGMGDWTLWVPFDGADKLSLTGEAVNMRAAVNRCFDAQTLEEAMNFETTVLGSGISGSAEAAKMFAPPVVETEGIDRFLGLTTQLSAGAAPLPMDKSLIFPEEKDNKIACDISLLIPRKELALRDLGEEKFYDVDVVGEVVREDRLIDNFKYRFDIPWDEVGGDKLPLTVRRYLYPGDYELRVKAGDANRKAEGRIVEKLKVPEKAEPPPTLLAAASLTKPGSPAAPSDFRPSSISILSPVREILTGLQRFETRSAVGIQAVDFYLDGTKVLTRTRQPFEADLNLGPLPRKHAIKVVGYDGKGRAVGEDELTINEGSESFRVKIVSPMRGAKVSGPTEVVADATAPEGRKITRLEFYSNDTRIATLYQPPWQQVVPIRKSESIGYIRVVGTLDDGLVAEDLRYVNAPAYISEVNVDAVELYTAVTEHHRPVEGLTAANFKVFEDGKEQQIGHFEQVRNLPLTVGVAIDTSASMIENLPEAEKAAVQFIVSTVQPKDRGFTMSFDDSPYTLCKLTGQREALERSFAGLRAEGSTALYDAIIYALYQFQGVKGKKALVLLTDGKDTSSKYDFDVLLDYVKKAGVSIYAIGLNIPKAEFEVKSKLNRLSETSGGATFYIDTASRLDAVYKQINDELRTQYLLTYYSTNVSQDNKWRKIEVKTTPPTLVARTISGYYP